MAHDGLSSQEFRDRLARDYPAPLADAAFNLDRIRREESLDELDGIARSLVYRGALGWFALRSRQRPAQPLDPSEIVVLYLPARPDYADLLGPPTVELLRRGHRVRVLVPGRRPILDARFGGAAVSPLEHFGGAPAYRAARGGYLALLPALRRFARDFGLHRRQWQHLALAMQTYMWERAVFGAALSLTGAEVVLGIHFTLGAGLLGAIRTHRQTSGRALPVALMQHGTFSRDWPDHDFHGADLVLTWGPYYQRELAAFPGATPPTRVIGHPRFEGQGGARPARARPARPTVLYIGTNGEERADRAALELVATALGGEPDIDVIYRPHPDEPMDKYAALVERGAISREAMRQGTPAGDLLMRADVVLGTQSTLLLEGIASGVPGIQVLPERFAVDWAARGMPSASDPVALRRQVRAALAAPASTLAASRPLIRDMFGAGSPSAAAAADAIEDLLAGSRKGARAA